VYSCFPRALAFAFAFFRVFRAFGEPLHFAFIRAICGIREPLHFAFFRGPVKGERFVYFAFQHLHSSVSSVLSEPLHLPLHLIKLPCI
jgi:hypothetical protein